MVLSLGDSTLCLSKRGGQGDGRPATHDEIDVTQSVRQPLFRIANRSRVLAPVSARPSLGRDCHWPSRKKAAHARVSAPEGAHETATLDRRRSGSVGEAYAIRVQNGRVQNGRVQNGRVQNGRVQNGKTASQIFERPGVRLTELHLL